MAQMQIHGGRQIQAGTIDASRLDAALLLDIQQGGDAVTPTFPVVDLKIASALGAGVTETLDSVVIPNGKIAKVQQITLSSSAACKWEIQSSTVAVVTDLDVVFTSGVTGNTPTHEWEPPHRDYVELVGNGSNTFFRVSVTNLDARNPANAYVTFFFDEVDA